MLFGWVDFSDAEYRRTLAVLEALQEQGVLDELGIGAIRDAFSNYFFPGISTAQTRAKYFVVLPHLFAEAMNHFIIPARESGQCTGREVKKWLEKRQDEVRDIFKENSQNQKGIIGQRSKIVLRKPSDVYWTGLKCFGIVNPTRFENKPFSAFCNSMGEQICQKAELQFSSEKKDNKNEREDDFCDCNGSLTGSGYLFSCMEGDSEQSAGDRKTWAKNLDIQLTKKEAEYLLDKILSSARTKESLLAQLLRFYSQKQLECSIENFDDIPPEAVNPQTQRAIKMAQQFRRLVYICHLAYACLVAGDNREFWEEYDLWKQEDYSDISVKPIFEFVGTSIKSQTCRFLCTALENIKNKDWENFEKTIRDREHALKRGREKIGQPNARFEPFLLDYRASRAGVIIRDILQGLNREEDP